MVTWTRDSDDHARGVSDKTDTVYLITRGTSDRPLWLVSETLVGHAPRSLTGTDLASTAKAYCERRDERRETGGAGLVIAFEKFNTIYRCGDWTIEPNGGKWHWWALCYRGSRVNTYPTVREAEADYCARADELLAYVEAERNRIVERRHL